MTECELIGQDRRRYSCCIPIVILTLLAAALRLYGLWQWQMIGDEVYTVMDATRFWQFGRGFRLYPAYYFITWVLFAVTGSQSVVLARIPALIFGVATIPLFWYYGRRVLGKHAAFVAVAIIAVMEWHIMYSKIARFYSGIFLFAGLSILWLLIAVRENRLSFGIGSLVAGLLATTLHPSGAFVLAGGGLYMILLSLMPRLHPTQSIRAAIRGFLVPLLLLSIPAVMHLIRALSGWHSKGLKWNYTPIHTILGIARTYSFIVFLMALSGLLICWFYRRHRAIFLGCYIIAGFGALLVLSPFVDVRPDYVSAVVPALIFLAASLCVVPFESKQGSPKLVAVLAMVMIAVVGQLPETLSHFTEKQHNDPKLPGLFVKERMLPSDQFVVYMSGVGPHLGRPHYRMGQLYQGSARWQEGLSEVEQADHRTWFVLSYPRIGLPAPLSDWLNQHAKLMKRWRSKRFDYLTRDIEVWLFDPEWPTLDLKFPRPDAEGAAETSPPAATR
jgi:Flp pilus assembly pilin Flp